MSKYLHTCIDMQLTTLKAKLYFKWAFYTTLNNIQIKELYFVHEYLMVHDFQWQIFAFQFFYCFGYCYNFSINQKFKNKQQQKNTFSPKMCFKSTIFFTISYTHAYRMCVCQEFLIFCYAVAGRKLSITKCDQIFHRYMYIICYLY